MEVMAIAGNGIWNSSGGKGRTAAQPWPTYHFQVPFAVGPGYFSEQWSHDPTKACQVFKPMPAQIYTKLHLHF